MPVALLGLGSFGVPISEPVRNVADRVSRLFTQLFEQPLGVRQIGRIEPLREPAVDGHEEITSFDATTLVVPEPGEARGCAQLPELGTLAPSDRKRLPESEFGSVWLSAREQGRSPEPIQLRLK